MKEIKNSITIIVVSVTVLLISMFVLGTINTCENKQTKKDNNVIENNKYSNDSIRIELKHIDKDKNEKIIEVKGLNNDSTYKLFKRLIAE